MQNIEIRVLIYSRKPLLLQLLLLLLIIKLCKLQFVYLFIINTKQMSVLFISEKKVWLQLDFDFAKYLVYPMNESNAKIKTN